jgi:hypothetical protein
MTFRKLQTKHISPVSLEDAEAQGLSYQTGYTGFSGYFIVFSLSGRKREIPIRCAENNYFS